MPGNHPAHAPPRTLEQPGHKVGVLMNEAGEVSIDGPRAGAIAEQVLNLAGGCICW